MPNAQQLEKIGSENGFIAALDQSGGSTPKALANYGVDESAYSSEQEMFLLVHAMRSRIIMSPAFNGEKILGAILFEKTMDAMVGSMPTAQYLWERLSVVPFLKVDKGLAPEQDGVQVMNDMPDLGLLLERAVQAGIFGTKMRSVINSANPEGIARVVAQQFEVAQQILAKGLIPIIEPEVNINAPDKAECETILKTEILKHLDSVPSQVIFKLTLPETGNFYSELTSHPNTLRVVALSGGYDLTEACARLSQNDGMIASFSRALTNGLSQQQSDKAFDAALQNAIDTIYAASVAGGTAQSSSEAPAPAETPAPQLDTPSAEQSEDDFFNEAYNQGNPAPSPPPPVASEAPPENTPPPQPESANEQTEEEEEQSPADMSDDDFFGSGTSY